eukprot:TRINITY_DN2008_c0_g1_i2.p1 TRINITY_DN2008_c0_g1~~TRINITY_DN2008_c0_g1_i2.p1  ORF type:complete len:547 (-),score=54.10 TRINITY_DN2008_c0_g1_i2:143-1783(-)
MDLINEQLPEETMLHVFSFLSSQELVQASSVCKLWNEISEEESLWRNLLSKKWKVRNLVVSSKKSNTYKSQFIMKTRREKNTKKIISQYQVTEKWMMIEKLALCFLGMFFLTNFIGATLPVETTSIISSTTLLALLLSLVSLLDPSHTARFFNYQILNGRVQVYSRVSGLLTAQQFTLVLSGCLFLGGLLGGLLGHYLYSMLCRALEYVYGFSVIFVGFFLCLYLIHYDRRHAKTLCLYTFSSTGFLAYFADTSYLRLYGSNKESNVYINCIVIGLFLGGTLGLIMGSFKQNLVSLRHSIFRLEGKNGLEIFLWGSVGAYFFAHFFGAYTLIFNVLGKAFSNFFPLLPQPSTQQLSGIISFAWVLGAIVYGMILKLIFTHPGFLRSLDIINGGIYGALTSLLILYTSYFFREFSTVIFILQMITTVMKGLVTVTLFTVLIPWLSTRILCLEGRAHHGYNGIGLQYHTIKLLFYCGTVIGLEVGFSDAKLLYNFSHSVCDSSSLVACDQRLNFAFENISSLALVGGGIGQVLVVLAGDIFLDVVGPF